MENIVLVHHGLCYNLGAMRQSILAALLIFAAGCAHEQFMTDAKHPEIEVNEFGTITYRGKVVEAEDLPGLLEDSGLTHQNTIHIRIPSGLTDYRVPYHVMGQLVRKGYRRPVLVEDRKATSTIKPKAPPPVRAGPPARRPIRYK